MQALTPDHFRPWGKRSTVREKENGFSSLSHQRLELEQTAQEDQSQEDQNDKLWLRDLPAPAAGANASAQQAGLQGAGLQDDSAEYFDSVCCWNVCPAFYGEVKRARGSEAELTSRIKDADLKDANDGKTHNKAGTHAAGLIPGNPGWLSASTSEITGKTLRPMPAALTNLHLTHRLLVESVAPNQHVVFNPLSGAVDLASDADLAWLDDLRRGKTQSLTPAQEAIMRDRRYLFDSPADEEACLEAAVERGWARMTLAQPQMYTICPTLACNLACAYCFEGDSLTDKAQGVMTEEQVAHAFAAIGRIRQEYAEREDEQSGAPYIALFGGEPLLPSTRRSVAEILRLAAEGGFLVGATTNGVNLTRFEDLLTEYADILTVFQVTLDGPKAVHDARRHRLGGQGTFDEIVRGIDLLLFLGIGVDLRVNLDAANVDELPALVDFIFGKGWNNHPAFDLALAPITIHGEEGGCRSRYDKALSELELAQRVMALVEKHPRVAQVCHLGFLRHLEYLVSVLEPEKLGRGRRGAGRTVGPRYWYCEASTDKQYVFTPEGLIYNCTEGVGQPVHAVGRFDPALDLWAEERGQWVGRTILSHPKCRECAISTLCGGGCHVAARERAGSSPDPLLQIALPGRAARGEAMRRPSKPSSSPASKPSSSLEPFCNAAEETVRAYLRAVGRSAAFQNKRPKLSPATSPTAGFPSLDEIRAPDEAPLTGTAFA